MPAVAVPAQHNPETSNLGPFQFCDDNKAGSKHRAMLGFVKTPLSVNHMVLPE